MSKIATAFKASSSRFAAAFGFPDAHAEDPKDKDKDAKKPARLDGESDEDYSKRCEEEEKKTAEDGKEGKPEGAAEDDDEDEKKKDEAKKAAAAGRAEGVKAERDRWTAVLSAPEAKNRGLVAASLLADTDMEASALITVLKATPEAKSGGLYARMAAAAVVPTPSPSAVEGAAPGSAAATAKQIANAAAKARGEKAAA